MLGMIRQSGIENALHLLMSFEEIGHLSPITVMLFHTHTERLHSTQHQPAFKRRENSTGALLHECEGLFVFRLGADKDSAQSIAVSIQELCSGVHHDVGAQSDRPLEIG